MQVNRTDWFHEAGFGLFVHWTQRSQPKGGELKPYAEAVRDFRVNDFAAQVEEAGAKFVIFSISHSIIHLPFPCPELDAMLPGHTCERDLIADLADALEARGIKLMLYYNPDGRSARDWVEFSGFYSDHARHAELTYELTRAISLRYGRRIHGWWIDCCLEPPVGDSCKRYDYVKFADSLRAGNPDSIVTFNYRGIEKWGSELGRGIIDYQSGEGHNLDRVPESRFSGEGGSQWFSVIPMEFHEQRPILHRNWLHSEKCEPVPLYSNEAVYAYLRDVRANGGVFAYNVGPYQEGLISEKTMEQLKWLNHKFN